jgi:hypothetical protein
MLIKDKHLRIFAEYASFTDSLPKKQVSLERVVVNDSLASGLTSMDILSLNQGYYFIENVSNPCMVLAKVAGLDKAEYGLTGTKVYPLLYKRNDHFWISTSQLSNFAKVRFMPENKWKIFWETIIGDITGKELHFKEWPSYVHPTYSRDQQLPDSARVASVRRGVQWFYNGHFLVSPESEKDWLEKYEGDGSNPVGPALPADIQDGDGSLGILEGHYSAIYSDGNQAYRYWMRGDVQGEASMTFAIAAKLLGNDDYSSVSRNLINYLFKEFRKGERADPSSASFGLLSWAITHQGTYYGDDNARAILGLILSSSILNYQDQNEKIVEAILSNFRTTGVNGFRGNMLEDDEIQAKGWKYFQKRDLLNPHPHFESWLWACYLWLYRQTGYQPLYDLCEKGISLMMQAYPHWNWTNGIQQEKARMMLPLAWLYRVSPTDEHKEWLTFMVDEFLKNQQDCGAIREQLGDNGKGQWGKLPSNEAYGTGEAPLIFDNGDPISDMLYTCNFGFFGLNEAACATNDPKIKEAANKLSDFLTRIQVRSEKVKNIDGAWFRAFNYRNWDYWASNADWGWGANCTLTGWIQSWIVTTQALMEMDTSYWDITTSSTIGKDSSEIFKSMLK